VISFSLNALELKLIIVPPSPVIEVGVV